MEADQVADMQSDVQHAADISADGVDGVGTAADPRAVSPNAESEPTFKAPPPVQRGMSAPTFKPGQGKAAPPKLSESEAKQDSEAPRNSSASTGAYTHAVHRKTRFLRSFRTAHACTTMLAPCLVATSIHVVQAAQGLGPWQRQRRRRRSRQSRAQRPRSATASLPRSHPR